MLNQYQLRLPMVDVASIGAGGGSIAWVDGRRLRIGPQSASASPGPACYGLGGEEPTVTDADVVLGYLSPDRFLGGRMTAAPDRAADAIDAAIARSAVRRRRARSRGRHPQRHRQPDGAISSASRRCERGYDPRDFVMMAYGGAGPVHAASYGGEVGVREIIMPFYATVHSAYGAALSDVRFSLQHSDPLVLPVAPAKVEAHLRGDGGGRRARSLARRRRAARAAALRALGRGALSAPGAPRARAGARDASTTRAWHGDRGGLRGASTSGCSGTGAALKDAGIELVNYGVDAIGVVRASAPEHADRRAAPPSRVRDA